MVQYNTLQNPIDLTILLALIRRSREFWAREEIARIGPVELVPGAQVQSDEELMASIRGGLLFPGIAHPCGTCSVGKEERGGCVGVDLRVHGVKGLSVVE